MQLALGLRRTLRLALCWVLGLCIALGLPQAAFGSDDAHRLGSFSFAFISDPHVGYGPGNRNLETAAGVLAAMKPKFIVAGGDLTERGLASEYESYAQIMQGAAAPVYAIPGNHDVRWTGNPLYESYFGRSYASFSVEGYHFVLLNTALSGQPEAYIDEAQLQWLRRDLAQISPETPVIVFSHHPLDQGAVGNELRVLDLLSTKNTVLLCAGHSHNLEISSRGTSTFIVDAGILEGSFLWVDVKQNIVSVESVDFVNEARKRVAQIDTTPRFRPIGAILASNEQDGLTVRVTCSQPGVLEARVGQSEWVELSGDGYFKSGKLSIEALVPGEHILQVRLRVNDQVVQWRSTKVSILQQHSVLSPMWVFRTSSSIQNGLSTDGLMVFVLEDEGYLTALDPKTGTTRFRAGLGAPAVGQPVIAAEAIVCVTADGRVLAFDRLTGVLKWHAYGYEGSHGSPAVDGDIVLVTHSTKVSALDATSGARLWTFDTGVQLAATLSASEGRAYVGCYDGMLRCLDYSGNLLWESKVENTFYHSPVFSAPTIAGDLVVVTTPLNTRGTSQTVHALCALAGEPVWAVNAGTTLGAPVNTNSGLFVATAVRRLVLISDGQIAKRLDLPPHTAGTASYGASVSVSEDGSLVAWTDTKGYVHLVDSNMSSDVRTVYSMGANSYVAPVWIGNVLVAACMDGSVRAFQVRP